ncbi:MAG: hypothetical protein NTZ19_00115 [Bacteroidetes bacterium]|nr:hypothetical protein [Bacteroidota bacterium]
MNNKMYKSLLGGFIGTTAMSLVMFIAPMMGMPKMSPPNMLAGMMRVPVIVGWVMHFVVGIIFAFGYTYLFAPKVKIGNSFLKGTIFGFVVFIIAQIMMGILGTILPMPEMEGSMVLIMIGSISGHIVYGIALSKTIS